jgi:hypothetical protein
MAMFEDDSIFSSLSPQRVVQRVGDWFGQRAEYRKQALAILRRRENLPTSVRLKGDFYQREDGEFYNEPPGKQVWLDTTLYPNGKGGYSVWATGTRKGTDIAEADQHWNRDDNQFEILSVAEDGRKLSDELRDLSRDAAGFEVASKVSHGQTGEQAPDLVLDGTSDEEVDARLQEYLRRGPQ